MTQLTVTERDLRRLLDVVDPARSEVVSPGMRTARPDELVPSSFFSALAELVPCDDMSFLLMDTRQHRILDQSMAPGCPPVWDDQVSLSGDETELFELFWLGFWECQACSYPQHTGEHIRAARASDFYTRPALDRLVMGAYFRKTGLRHEVLLPMPPVGALDRRLLLFRDSGRDFSDREVLLLGLLRPHLIALHQLHRFRHTGQPELTPRQWQIMRLVAAGCTNRQIATALFVSEATVRKHLENTYARLGVTNRVAALAKVGPLLDI